MNRRLTLATITALVVSSSAQAGTVLYVDDDVQLGGDGLSWGTAYRFLQDALASAAPGTEIRVGQGLYQTDHNESNPNPNPTNCCNEHEDAGCDDAACEALVCAMQPTCCNSIWASGCAEEALALCVGLTCPDKLATFHLPSGIAIVGGFAGIGAPDPDERNLALYVTVLCGDLLGNDLPDFENTADNTFHVVTTNGANATAILDGITITAGAAHDMPKSDHHHGGGIYNVGGTPTIINCDFLANYADLGGAIANLDGGDATIVNCAFLGNGVFLGGIGNGAAVYNEYSSPMISNSIFSDNVALGGGGVYNLGSDPVLIECTFNQGRGGGVYNATSNPLIFQCTFHSDQTEVAGASALVNEMSSPTLVGCSFSGQWVSYGFGGAVRSVSSSTVFEDCVFEGVIGATHGGAVSDSSGTSTFVGCVFSNNVSDFQGGAVAIFEGNAQFTDCVFTGNQTLAWGGGCRVTDGSTVAFSQCAFVENTVAHMGGGAAIAGAGALATFANCSFEGNSADGGGGGLLSLRSEVTVWQSVFLRNSTAQDGGGGLMLGTTTITACAVLGNTAGRGGGFYAEGNNTVTGLVNCIMVGNSAADIGGAIRADGVLEVTNCTVHANTAAGGAMALYVTGAASTLTNCIIRGSSGDLIGGSAMPVVSWSDVEGGFTGAGNIDADPLFLGNPGPGLDGAWGSEDDDYGDLRLSPGSPCVDAGDNAAVPDGVDTDLDGNPRFHDDPGTPDTGVPGGGHDAIVDMGAYEFNSCPFDCDGSNDGNVNVTDLLELLGQYDPLAPAVCGGGESCDYDGNGCVDFSDLLELLAHYTLDPAGVGCQQ